MASSFSFNSEDFKNGLKKYEKKALDGLLAGLVAGADELLRDSTAIVPFDKGFSGGLASTASKTDPKFAGSEAEVTVGYNKVYAARLHEDMSLNISQRRSGGKRRQQKYLEKPMKENGKKYVRLIAEILEKRT